MDKIATPKDLNAELTRLLAACQGQQRPSRFALASELRRLADRVFVAYGEREAGQMRRMYEYVQSAFSDLEKYGRQYQASKKRDRAKIGPMITDQAGEAANRIEQWLKLAETFMAEIVRVPGAENDREFEELQKRWPHASKEIERGLKRFRSGDAETLAWTFTGMNNLGSEILSWMGMQQGNVDMLTAVRFEEPKELDRGSARDRIEAWVTPRVVGFARKLVQQITSEREPDTNPAELVRDYVSALMEDVNAHKAVRIGDSTNKEIDQRRVSRMGQQVQWNIGRAVGLGIAMLKAVGDRASAEMLIKIVGDEYGEYI